MRKKLVCYWLMELFFVVLTEGISVSALQHLTKIYNEVTVDAISMSTAGWKTSDFVVVWLS